MSLTGAGICTLNGNTNMYTVETEPGLFKNRYKRIDYIVRKCFEYIDGAELVCIEQGFFHKKNVSGAMDIAGLNYMIRRELTYAGIKWVEAAPSQLKKFILGSAKGKSAKELIMLNVYKKYKVEPADNNQADACVLAHIAEAIARSKRNEWPNLAKYQLEVVHKIIG